MKRGETLDEQEHGSSDAWATAPRRFTIDVFHVLASKACVGVVVVEDDVESQKGITHRDALSARCGSDKLAHRAPVRGGRQGGALHPFERNMALI